MPNKTFTQFRADNVVTTKPTTLEYGQEVYWKLSNGSMILFVGKENGTAEAINPNTAISVGAYFRTNNEGGFDKLMQVGPLSVDLEELNPSNSRVRYLLLVDNTSAVNFNNIVVTSNAYQSSNDTPIPCTYSYEQGQLVLNFTNFGSFDEGHEIFVSAIVPVSAL
jgi:hypothetical protein